MSNDPYVSAEQALAFLPAASVREEQGCAFVSVVRSREELRRWLHTPSSHLQWIQVEELLGDPEAWAEAAQGAGDVPLDVIMTDPETEFSQLYRLVDVSAARDVRVTIPVTKGFSKAVRLAASLGLPIRILPGQPTAEMLAGLEEMAEFYLRDPTVEAPVEPFHSLLVAMRGAAAGTLWTILEDDPDVFAHLNPEGRAILPRSSEPAPPGFVSGHLERLVEQRAECADCAWQELCVGYFKWPDSAYRCDGVKQLFARIAAAADEIGADLAAAESEAK